ncbi:hypothetical protein YDYSG_19550 [Paenibacillus tyrfis]|nr:hypothetical protein YDYSG_19550 [Paenibacillus tyrfis]GMX61353.1 hypothetical protein Elgi_11570 [Paenibacillus elgii]
MTDCRERLPRIEELAFVIWLFCSLPGAIEELGASILANDARFTGFCRRAGIIAHLSSSIFQNRAIGSILAHLGSSIGFAKVATEIKIAALLTNGRME